MINKFRTLVISLLALFLSFTLFETKVSGFTLTESPTGICVTYYDDIDSRGFAWQTSTLIEETKLLILEDAPTLDWNNARVIEGTYTDFREYRCHKAHVTDLESGKYYYKVGGNNSYSSVGTFVIDDASDNIVNFTYVTDSQASSIEGFGQFKKSLVNAVKYDTDFIAFAGDLVDNSHANWGSDLSKIVMEEWSYAFDVPKEIIMNYPMVSAAGNHERGGYSFYNHNNIDFVNYDDTGAYYSLDYDNLHLTVLNTNSFESGTEAVKQAQLDWLESDLSTTDKPWKIVMMHVGPYSTGDHTNDDFTKYIRNTLPQIFAKYKVDLVLQGHDHVYTRTMPYLYGEGENGRIANRNETYIFEDGYNWSLEPDGTYYITINHCGVKSYPPLEYDTSRIFPATSPVNGKIMSQEIKERMFANVKIDGDKLLLRSFISYEDGTDELYDYIAIKKNTYQDAIVAIDKLPQTVTPRDSIMLEDAYNKVSALSERAKLYLTQERIDKLDNLLSTFVLADGLQANNTMLAIDKLDTEILDEVFWANYRDALNLYFNLTNEQKELVDNSEFLLTLKDNINEKYYLESVQTLINKVSTAKDKKEAQLIALNAYNLLSEEAKKKLTGTEILYEEFPALKTKGCGGNIYGSIFAVIILSSCIFIIKRKRGAFYEEN